MENHNHIRRPPLNVSIFIIHMRNWVMGTTPMHVVFNVIQLLTYIEVDMECY